MFSITSLTYARENKSIFRELTLSLKKGEITTIFGPSGIGKTTFIQLISGYLRPDSGEIVFDGAPLPLSRLKLYALRKRMGFLLQSSSLFSKLTAFENIALPLRTHTMLPEALIQSIVSMKLHTVGLSNVAQLYPRELSGGMARRVAAARAMALDPEILLFDEPFVGLDPVNIQRMLTLLKTLNESSGVTIVMVSHDVPESLSISHTAYLLMDGKVALEGSGSEFLAQKSDALETFLSRPLGFKLQASKLLSAPLKDPTFFCDQNIEPEQSNSHTLDGSASSTSPTEEN